MPENAGSVFQVASQFNCLEMSHPGVTPQDGVTNYIYDRTQGPACSLMCPAATVFRNYFVNGEGQAEGKQLDLLSDVAHQLDNARHGYWKMKNGYCLPTRPDAIGDLHARFTQEKERGVDLCESLKNHIRVGVQWDTEIAVQTKSVKSPDGGWINEALPTHRLCQVFCSGLPLSYSKYKNTNDEWKPFALTVLRGVFEATIAVGAILAKRQNKRIKIYLTQVGAGVFGNEPAWVSEAIERSLEIYRDAPLDVILVHFGTLMSKPYANLEKYVKK